MAGERRSGRRHVAVSDDRLRSGIPVPQQDGAVGRAAGDVTIGRDVALGSRQARDHSVMAEDYLHDFRCEREQSE